VIGFGLRLTLRGGREALVRLMVTALSVAIGVGLLLSVLAMYHAYRDAVASPCWQCPPAADANGPLLWDYDKGVYAGRDVERLDVAVLAPGVPTMPGLPAMPAAGQYYASPALAVLLRTVPPDELGDRFPGTLAGTIGRAGLQHPDELAIVIGHRPDDLPHRPSTIRVSTVETAPRGLDTSALYQFGFALGAVALLVPMLALIGTATRMAAARREERYAAMRLVGAERGQINAVASIDAVVGAAFGAVVGIGVYAALRPALGAIPLLGYRFYDSSITPTGWGYTAALVAVPAAAAVTCLASLRRIQISPLGVTRRVTPPAPRVWRVVPLLIGLTAFVVPLLATPSGQQSTPGPAAVALVLVMAGLMIAGPWLTMTSARLLAWAGGGGSRLLAARRLADNPRSAFRAVSGLVLTVMVGTVLAALVPAALAAQDTTRTGALANVVRVGFDNGNRAHLEVTGLSPQDAAPVLAAVTAVPGTSIIPIYYPSPARDPLAADTPIPGTGAVIRCADAAKLPVLGTCPTNASAVLIDARSMFTDNLRALDRRLPFITAASPITTDDGSGQLATLMVVVDGPATLERVRTVLSVHRDDIAGSTAPMTFGEVAEVRATLYREIQRVVTIIAAVTLLVAGCGLAVAISGSLVERKRPFTLLRVTGTDVATLYRAVLLETVLPLIAATAVATGVGLALAYPLTRALAPAHHGLVLPSSSYYLTLGGGLLTAVAVVVATLPILGRITATENARFE
jgi:hypothetical protein